MTHRKKKHQAVTQTKPVESSQFWPFCCFFDAFRGKEIFDIFCILLVFLSSCCPGMTFTNV